MVCPICTPVDIRDNVTKKVSSLVSTIKSSLIATVKHIMAPTDAGAVNVKSMDVDVKSESVVAENIQSQISWLSIF